MTRHHPAIYKEITYAQLRSFSETARLGTMSAAAKALQLSHPTVWKQIRMLEERLGQTLLEVRGRRCLLTPAGRTLSQMVQAVVAELETLPERFQQEYESLHARLVVAATTRVCIEEMPLVIREFRQRCPHVQLIVRELFEHQGTGLLETGEVDILLDGRMSPAERKSLNVEACFDIEPILVLPPDHPLVRKRRLEAKDLAKYPVLNRSDDGYPDEEVCDTLRAAGAFEHPGRAYDLKAATSIRLCTRMGFGIGIVGRVRKDQADPELCERSLSHLFRSIRIFAYSNRTLTKRPALEMFVSLLQELLGNTKPVEEKPSAK